MVTNQIRFDDGAAYERYMGKWSQLAGETFLDWLAPKPGLRWLDVGCGNGAFTEMLVERCAPASVDGIDPSEAQLAYARTRPASRVAQFRQGDAMALPFPDDTFDAAVMPLVIFFVPDPAKGVAEMARVVAPRRHRRRVRVGHARRWFPYDALQVEMRGTGRCGSGTAEPGRVPNRRHAGLVDRCGLGRRRNAGDHRAANVRRFRRLLDDHPRRAERRLQLASMAPEDLAVLQARMRARLPSDAAGRITYTRPGQRRERSRARQMNRAIIAARCP